MGKNKKDRLEITEMFMAKTSPNNCYYGCIKRLKDDYGNPFVFSRIVMPNGLLCAQAPNQIELGDTLDKLAVLVIKGNLHGDVGKRIEIFGTDLFLN